jgi:antagonist of KipI
MKDVLRVVISAGLLTTIQDLGRPNAIASGVMAGGAMDRFAHAAANLIVGNDRSAATIECTVSGPRLVAAADCLVAITGGGFDPRVNGGAVPMWTGVPLAAGDELRLGISRRGARAYIAVAGGVMADRWLGSMSTNLLAARGGMHGRALVEGDVIVAGPSRDMTARSLAETLRPRYDDHTLNVIAGPHTGMLTGESRAAIFDSAFTVSHESNRMGYRLDGPALETGGEEVLSFGLVPGALQVPSGGRPILLMADHQTAGGYPVVATVISASMPVAAQLAPGDELRFAEISIEKALAMRAAQRAALESLTS